MTFIKKLHKSKTILFSWALVVLGILETNMHLLKELLGDWYGVSFIAVAAIVATLRMVTTQSIKEKE